MAELTLAADEVHVWHVPHQEHLPHLDQLAGLLNAEERERAGRFHFERDRATYTLSRAYLRLFLQKYGIAPAAEISFTYAPRGKPELHACHAASWLQFNLAHSRGMTVLAFALARPVGIDVETLRELHDAAGIVGSIFAPEEQAAFHALAPEARQRGFFNGWTRKEAFIKATGEGLGRQLDSFAVTLTPGESAGFLRLDTSAGDDWFLADLTLAPPHIVALATRGSGLHIRNRVWPAQSTK